MKRLMLMFITTLIMAGNAIAGSIYKCVDAKGNVSFSQIPCLNKSKGGIIGNTEDSEPTPRGERRSLQRGGNPYSIRNQAREIKHDQDTRAIKRRIHGSSPGYGGYGSYGGSGGYNSYGEYGRSR